MNAAPIAGLAGLVRARVPRHAAPRRIARHIVTQRLTEAVVGGALVAATTAVLVAADADLTFASITLLVAVAAAAALSYTSGLVAAVTATAALTYSFTPPLHSLSIGQPDDVLALVAFVTASVVVGATVARLAELRREAALAAREAQLRLELTNDLVAGVPTARVLDALAVELVDLFDLASCDVVVGGEHSRAFGASPAIDRLQVHALALDLDLELGRGIGAGEQGTIEALAAGMAAALDRERLDREARDQRMRADLDRARASFLTAVTHDLRTPIATIKTATGSLLAPGPSIDDDDRSELLHAAYEGAVRLDGLVTKVLELTRIRTGIRPERRDIAPADLVQAAAERLGALARERVITLDIDPDVPAVHVDPLLMEHVVVNLLENAIHHDHSGGEILVWARSDDGVVRLGIADHGDGIAPADRSRVFEEFVALDRRVDGAGTGLGLAIVRALTEANDGTVCYEDTPGGGATFVVTLPTRPAEERVGP